MVVELLPVVAGVELVVALVLDDLEALAHHGEVVDGLVLVRAAGLEVRHSRRTQEGPHEIRLKRKRGRKRMD